MQHRCLRKIIGYQLRGQPYSRICDVSDNLPWNNVHKRVVPLVKYLVGYMSTIRKRIVSKEDQPVIICRKTDYFWGYACPCTIHKSRKCSGTLSTNQAPSPILECYWRSITTTAYKYKSWSQWRTVYPLCTIPVVSKKFSILISCNKIPFAISGDVKGHCRRRCLSDSHQTGDQWWIADPLCTIPIVSVKSIASLDQVPSAISGDVECYRWRRSGRTQ